MLVNYTAFKYEITDTGQFEITKCWTNCTVTLQYGAIKSRCNICRIKPYISDTKFEYITPENMYDDVNI